MKIWLAGGGTGGHLCPGLALADELKKMSPDIDIGFLGTNEGLDREILWGSGYNLRILAAGRGSPFSWRRPLNLPKFIWSMCQSWYLFQKTRPSAVIALGGFAAATPGLMTSWFRFSKIPLFILEQNTVPGRVNRYLSGLRTARQIFSQFSEARNYFKDSDAEFFHIGSPLREPYRQLAGEPLCNGDSLLIMGGSQGAKRLNELVTESARRFSGETGCRIIHVAGPDHEHAVKAAYARAGVQAEVYGFHNRMDDLYRRSRLVIARSGAISLAELAAAGLPAILVPLPSAMDDHQRKNAKSVAEVGAAISYEETTFRVDTFSPLVVSLWKDEKKRKEMAVAMRNTAMPDSGKEIAQKILACLTNK